MALTLIIGSTGMLGMALVGEAKARRLPVLGMARTGGDIQTDITDLLSLQRLLDTLHPTSVINSAALADVELCEKNPCLAWKVNARPVAILADYCRRRDIKFVQISSDHFYTGDSSARHTEEDAVTLVNEYARTKFAAESFALLAPKSYLIRTNIFGFRGKAEKPTLVEWAIQKAQTKEPITLFDDLFVSAIDVASLASVIFDLQDSDCCGIINVGSREVFSKKTMLEHIIARLGFDFGTVTIDSVRKQAIPRAESLGLDVRKAEAILGYGLPSLDEAVTSLVTH